MRKGEEWEKMGELSKKKRNVNELKKNRSDKFERRSFCPTRPDEWFLLSPLQNLLSNTQTQSHIHTCISNI